jgi:hypothetical protein
VTSSHTVMWAKASESLPPVNRNCIVWLVGTKYHSDAAWKREGAALMVRWDDPKHTDADGWADTRMDAARKLLDADALRVTHWALIEKPDALTDEQQVQS